MAENKKSFIAYSDWKDTFDELPNEKAGELIKHIFAYVNDENPISDDYLIKAVFANIKNTLKRDLEKWDKQYKQRVEAGKRSAEIRKRNATVVNDSQISSTVSDSVNVSVSENVNDIIKKENRFNFRKSLVDYGFDENLVTDWLIVRKNKKASNTKTAFNGFIKQVELCKMPINKILTECVNNSWKGFKADWITKSSVNKGKQTGGDEWRELGNKLGI